MKVTKDNYFIKIKHEFLFDTYNVFSSEYTPWVYLYLKFQKNYFVNRAPHIYYTINIKDIINYFGVNKGTIYKCLSELEEHKLLERKGKKYKLIDESIYLLKKKQNGQVTIDAEEGAVKEIKFIRIYNNDFEEFVKDIKEKSADSNEKKRIIIKTLRVHYYLISKNRHCIISENAIVESNENQTTLSRDLRHDHKYIKQILLLLKETGYIKLDDKGKIATINKKTYNPDFEIYKSDHDSSVNLSTNICSEKVDIDPKVKKLIDDLVNKKIVKINRVPDEFLGYTHNREGYISILTLNRNGQVQENFWHKGSPMKYGKEDWENYESLKNEGKNSKYYNPDSYWLHARLVGA